MIRNRKSKGMTMKRPTEYKDIKTNNVLQNTTKKT